jgi:hypothetical protein
MSAVIPFPMRRQSFAGVSPLAYAPSARELPLPDHTASFHVRADRLQAQQERQLAALSAARKTYLEIGRATGWWDGFKWGMGVGAIALLLVFFAFFVSGAASAMLK